jgi:catechol 2,3-dioxygenase-like lactoylglutathione lyase family enzyme
MTTPATLAAGRGHDKPHVQAGGNVMIKGVHAMFYAPNADELRAFFRDKLGLPWTDVGDGWLIFDTEGEVGCHPADSSYHNITFYCDDVHKTMAELKARGVEFTQDVVDEGWGLVTQLRAPGGAEIGLYQPKYQLKRPVR